MRGKGLDGQWYAFQFHDDGVQAETIRNISICINWLIPALSIIIYDSKTKTFIDYVVFFTVPIYHVQIFLRNLSSN